MEFLALAQIRSDHGVIDDAVLETFFKDRFQRGARIVARRRQLHQHTPGVFFGQRIADVDAVADREVDRDPGQQLEAGQRTRRLALRQRQQL
jgi:hypothetical protein